MMGRCQVFIDKNRIARSFLRGLATYDREAVVQERVNERLLALLLNRRRRDFRHILEIGCGTGLLTERLCRHLRFERLYLNDLVEQCYHPVVSRLPEVARPRVSPFFGDIERGELPPALDLVVSSSALQWLSDLDGFLQRVSAALSAGGALAFSMFGDGTLHELTELTGAGLSYHSFESVRDLVGRHLRVVSCGIERDRLFFRQPREVLRHVQATGVGGVGGYDWTPRRLERFEAAYRNRWGSADGVPVTYVSYTILAERSEG